MALATKRLSAGWHTVDDGTGDEQYWDGREWTMRRRMHEGRWLMAPADKAARAL